MARKKGNKNKENESSITPAYNLTTLRNEVVRTVTGTADIKKINNVAGRAYFNHIVHNIIEDIAGDNVFMEYVIGEISRKVRSQQDELFNIRVAKLMKAPLIEMFRKQIMEMMSHQKIELQDFLDEEQKKLPDNA